ncbi:MAG: RimK family alpha-L-glutamate ligase [Gammaproteobacteria bacterium]
MRPRVAIVTDDPGWHGRRLRQAFAARGFETRYVSLPQCGLVLDGGRAAVRMPGFDAAVPAGVFVRGVPGGSLEQIIRRLDLLHALRLSGTLVYNDARAIERTVDKAMTSLLLRLAGVPTPQSWVLESPSEAEALARQIAAEGGRLVCKPLFGSQGVGLRRIDDAEHIGLEPAVGGVWYLQRFVEQPGDPWYDYRVFVIAGRACAAMRRRNRHWITNRAQGARCEAVPLDVELRRLAEAAAAAIDIDYAGVDLIRGTDGNATVIEVNGVPAWYGLQRVTELDIAGALVDHFVARLAAAGRVEAVP